MGHAYMTIDKLHVAKAPGSQEVRYWNLVNTSASHFKGDDSKAFKVGAVVRSSMIQSGSYF